MSVAMTARHVTPATLRAEVLAGLRLRGEATAPALAAQLDLDETLTAILLQGLFLLGQVRLVGDEPVCYALAHQRGEALHLAPPERC